MTNETLHILDETTQEWGLKLDEVQLARFGLYLALLRKWNQRLNLTAIDDEEEIVVRHFLDSLACATVTGDLSGRSLVDVGTGAGFPGIPLRILYPQMSLTLVESVVKKTRFLETLLKTLGLDGVTVCAERVETVGHDETQREQYDWAVARGVGALPVLAEYLLPLCRIGGQMMALKGDSAADEVATAERALAMLGGGPARLYPVTLPGHRRQHYLVVIPKIAPTPAAYPRRAGQPAKRPL